MANFLAYPKFQTTDASGDLLNGGKLNVYEPGTTTRKTTYSDPELQSANTNPVILNARGEASVYFTGKARLVLTDSSDVEIWDLDNQQLSGDEAPEWVHELTGTHVDADTFTLSGDQTTNYHVSRRVKLVGDTMGTVYGKITASSFSSSTTTVDVTLDSGSIDNTLTTSFVGLPSFTNPSVPVLDEDNMASDSALIPPSQQSTKAYVDAQVTAQDLDFQADTGGALSIDLDSETMTFTGGTGIDTSGATNTVTFAIDSTVVTLTGSQTLTNKDISSSTNTFPDRLEPLSDLITGDLDAISENGFYYADTSATNKPASVNGHFIHQNLDSNSATQIFHDKDANASWFRRKASGTWQSWEKVPSNTSTDTLTNKTINLSSNTLTGTAVQFNTAMSDDDFATLTLSQTLTNKTIALASNTVSGTTVQFNTALTDGSFATLAGTETLTNKTIAAASNTLTIATTDLTSVTATAAEVNMLDMSANSVLFDSFNGVSLNTFNWNTVTGSDAQALDASLHTTTDGGVQLVSGDDAAATMAVNGSQMVGGQIWRAADGGLIFETHIQVSSITDVCVFVGFTDNTSLEMPFTLGASDTLTSNAANAVGFLFDTAADTDNIWKVGVANNVDATHTDTGVALSAGTYRRLRVEVDSSSTATFYLDGAQSGATMSNAFAGSNNLTPTLAVFSRTSSSKTLRAKYVLVQKTRLN